MSTFSTSSPSNFSSTPPSVHSSDSNDDVDVDMASLVSTFCATPDVTVSSPTSSFSTEPTNRHLNLAPKHRVKGSTKSFSCSFCGKTFLSRHYFRFHVTSVHQKQKNATCSQCSKSFSGDYYLKQVGFLLEASCQSFVIEEVCLENHLTLMSSPSSSSLTTFLNTLKWVQLSPVGIPAKGQFLTREFEKSGKQLLTLSLGIEFKK